MKPKIRELLHATPFAPFTIRMNDGRDFRIDHPDFVIATENPLTPVVLETHDGRGFFLAPALIASIEAAPAVA